MAEATELTTNWLRSSAAMPNSGRSGHIDANLILLNAANVTATAATPTAIDVEGGSDAEVNIQVGAVSGTTPTALFSIEVSVDGGSNYFQLFAFPVLNTADANQRIARVAWIPRPVSPYKTTKVRLPVTVGGTTPSFAITAFLRDRGYGASDGLEYLT